MKKKHDGIVICPHTQKTYYIYTVLTVLVHVPFGQLSGYYESYIFHNQCKKKMRLVIIAFGTVCTESLLSFVSVMS